MSAIALTLAAALATPGQAAPFDSSVGPAPAAHASKAMLEDIETMRLVLARKLGGQTSYTAAAWFGPSNNLLGTTVSGGDLAAPVAAYAPAQSAGGTYASYPVTYGGTRIADIEGVYLPRVGVVYTVTLPQGKGDPRLTPGMPAATASVSDWDRARMQLEGKAVAVAPPAARREMPVGESLLKALAENGKHFRDLRDDERVIVVVTFRKPTGDGNLFTTATTSSAPMAPARSGGGQSSSAPAIAASPAGSGLGGDADYDALADLHLKRGDYNRAIEAYSAAVKKHTTEFEVAEESARAEAFKRLRVAYSKLAQGYVAAGQFDKAKSLLESVGKLNDKAPFATTADKPPAAPPLPSRLVVSATKRQLDQAGAGKMSFEELSKAAQVDYHDPAATK